MYASRSGRYVCARPDLQPEAPLFRLLSRRWRPLASVTPRTPYGGSFSRRLANDEKASVSRNILFTKPRNWSPWLWER
jgi:hypothetical protein